MIHYASLLCENTRRTRGGCFRRRLSRSLRNERSRDIGSSGNHHRASLGIARGATDINKITSASRFSQVDMCSARAYAIFILAEEPQRGFLRSQRQSASFIRDGGGTVLPLCFYFRAHSPACDRTSNGGRGARSSIIVGEIVMQMRDKLACWRTGGCTMSDASFPFVYDTVYNGFPIFITDTRAREEDGAGVRGEGERE